MNGGAIESVREHMRRTSHAVYRVPHKDDGWPMYSRELTPTCLVCGQEVWH